MFNIPAATLSFWNRIELKPASDDQIAEVAGFAPGPLPDDYVAFLKTYGFARWMLTVPDRFRYTSDSGGQVVSKVGSIAHLETPESMGRAMAHAWTDQPEMGLPCWPEGVLPLAGNAGPAQVLMDFRGEAPVIRHWEPAEDPWGTGDNTALWHVADSFTDFINGLLMRDQV